MPLTLQPGGGRDALDQRLSGHRIGHRGFGDGRSAEGRPPALPVCPSASAPSARSDLVDAGSLCVGVTDHRDGCGQALPVQRSGPHAGACIWRRPVHLRGPGSDHGLLQLRVSGGIGQDEQPSDDAAGQAGIDDDG